MCVCIDLFNVVYLWVVRESVYCFGAVIGTLYLIDKYVCVCMCTPPCVCVCVSAVVICMVCTCICAYMCMVGVLITYMSLALGDGLLQVFVINVFLQTWDLTTVA